MKKALTGVTVLTDEGWQDGLALVIEDKKIAALEPAGGLSPDIPRETFEGAHLVPGFIDLQVNGGGGVMFNDCRNLKDLEKIAAAHRRFGTTLLLPTVISDDWEVMERCAALVREAIAAGLPGIGGIHFEGPYLNPARKGVHDETKLRPVDPGFFELVTQEGLGHVLVTLAPEMVLTEDIELFASAGVKLSAGHSMADYETAMAAFKAGVTGVTHLFNAMPPMESRNPGLVGAALTSPGVYCGIIADGFHVHPASLKTAIAAKGPDHIMLVTDAMAAVGSELDHFTFGGTEITVAGGRCMTKQGVLAGSHLDMAVAVQNTAVLLDQGEETAIRMASAVPAAFLGLDAGRITAGARADLVLLDSAGEVLESWIGGVPYPA